MPDRTARQEATVAAMIDIATQMAMQTQPIARRDVIELALADQSCRAAPWAGSWTARPRFAP